MKIFNFYLIFLLLLVSCKKESTLNIDPSVDHLLDNYALSLRFHDSIDIQRIETLFEENKQKYLNDDYIRNTYVLYHSSHILNKKNKDIEYLYRVDSLLNNAKKNKLNLIEVHCYKKLVEYYFSIKDLSTAYSFISKLEEIRDLSPKDKYWITLAKAKLHFNLKDFKKTNFYLDQYSINGVFDFDNRFNYLYYKLMCFFKFKKHDEAYLYLNQLKSFCRKKEKKYKNIKYFLSSLTAVHLLNLGKTDEALVILKNNYLLSKNQDLGGNSLKSLDLIISLHIRYDIPESKLNFLKKVDFEKLKTSDISIAFLDHLSLYHLKKKNYDSAYYFKKINYDNYVLKNKSTDFIKLKNSFDKKTLKLNAETHALETLQKKILFYFVFCISILSILFSKIISKRISIQKQINKIHSDKLYFDDNSNLKIEAILKFEKDLLPNITNFKEIVQEENFKNPAIETQLFSDFDIIQKKLIYSENILNVYNAISTLNDLKLNKTIIIVQNEITNKVGSSFKLLGTLPTLYADLTAFKILLSHLCYFVSLASSKVNPINTNFTEKDNKFNFMFDKDQIDANLIYDIFHSDFQPTLKDSVYYNLVIVHKVIALHHAQVDISLISNQVKISICFANSTLFKNS